jgi:hypothetical protein
MIWRRTASSACARRNAPGASQPQMNQGCAKEMANERFLDGFW